ncbi:MAG: transketolase C-terminal domain-containing protein [Candidatus Thermoplasmatota archaeon]|nr:transketolase C-terminal domain-containing protein [Candidatus Thermoplasmatota archaeon]
MLGREEMERKKIKEEGTTVIETGDHAVSLAAKFARADVVAAYPITPQTQIVEEIAKFVENGEMDAKFIRVESEHSAMAACIGASATGARAFTATSSQGLLLMHEMLFAAGGYRLPIVLANVNRSLFPPWSILVEHSDSLAQRDTGWIQFYCASNQEVFDTTIQAFKIAEEVNLPAMVNLEGFIMSHTHMPIELPMQDTVDRFLPRKEHLWKLDVDNPRTFGSMSNPEYYVLMRKSIEDAMEEARTKILDVNREFEREFGRSYEPIERYKCEDAETIIFAMGTIGKESKRAVDELRNEGVKAGAARVRLFRPFPEKEIKKIAESAEKLVVFDRDCSFGKGGVLSTEIRSVLDKPISSYIVGIGGLDVPYTTIKKCAERANGQKDEWITEVHP